MMLNPCPSRNVREKLVNSCVYELSFVLNSNVHKRKENKEFNIIKFAFI